MSIVGLDHVQVAAPPGCEDGARAFYGGLLGLDEIPKPALRELAERLQTAGAAIEWADAAELGSRERFHVRDPWGNRLELLAAR